MSKKIFVRSAAVLALALNFSTATAQDSAAENYLDFDRVDTNGDDCIDWEELRNGAMQFWDALDLNNDNIVAGDEHPEAVDANGEPVRPPSVAVTYYQSHMYVAFDQADKDQNACLSRREYESD